MSALSDFPAKENKAPVVGFRITLRALNLPHLPLLCQIQEFSHIGTSQKHPADTA